MRETLNPGFVDVPHSRWFEEARKHYIQTVNGLKINYDPELGDATRAAMSARAVDLWPAFDALSDLPLAALRGQNSNLLSAETFNAMRNRRPDTIAAEVPDRGHVPFLDEPQSLAIIERWLEEFR